MNGPEHYREAERLIKFWESGEPGGEGDAPEVLAAAQVHATLALAMATALSDWENEQKSWFRLWAGAKETT